MISTRAFLTHITHYDPRWIANKDNEIPFDLETGKRIVDAVAAAGLNTLIVDPKDGVLYESHPELRRPYTRPMTVLADLVSHARGNGLEVIVKLNFSQSELHQHNHWFRPHNGLFDNEEYWEHALEIIDELIEVVRPEKFFHVGMDEDHDRSLSQYVSAINRLHDEVVRRSLRPVIWNDSACLWPKAEVFREKSLFAEQRIPKDIIQAVWDYVGDAFPAAFDRLRAEGFDVWGAPGRTVELVRAMRDTLSTVGGTGIVITKWIPCIPANSGELLDLIRICGPACSSD